MVEKNTFSTVHLVKRLWRDFIRPFLPYIFLAVGFMIIYALTTAALPYLMKPVIDDVFKNENIEQLRWVSTLVLLTFVFKGAANYGETVTMNYIGQSIISNMQKKVFSHLLSADMAFYYRHPSGPLVSLGTYHITMIKNMVATTLTSIGKDSFTLLGLLGVMLYQDLTLSLIALVVLPISILPVSKLGKRMRRISNKTQGETGDWVSFMTQIFQGIRIVKSYNMESYETKRSHNMINRLLGYALKSGVTRSLSSPIMEMLGGVAIVVVISYGGWQVISGTNTAGAFFSFITALLLTYEPMKRLANLHANLQEGLAAAQEIFHVLDEKPTIISPKNAPSLTITSAEITLDKVTFSYGNHPVLHQFSLAVPPGKKVALVGPSGAGKSTVFNLLLRFFDPQSGLIEIDKQNIRDITLSSLRGSIALVSQEITLFDDTVEENIRYGNPNATLAQIKHAAQQAAATSFIEELPEQYQTLVGENGLKLSGGQRQRIAIARAILKDAPILLLDEATSSLDTESERLVNEALAHLMKNRTCIVIAHRLSTVQDADLIYVMEKGQVVETGTHKSLWAQNGLYTTLCKLQLSHE